MEGFIDILYADGALRKRVPISDKSKWYKELMGEEYITLFFNSSEVISFQKGDFIIWKDRRYYIVHQSFPKESSSGHYSYELRFDSHIEFWRTRILCYDRQNTKEGFWTLTAPAKDFMEIVVSNLSSNGFGNYTYSVEIDDPTLAVNLSFSNTSIFDALASIADAYKTEWWCEDRIIHLGKCSFGSGLVLDNTTIQSTTRSDSSDTEFFTRIYPLGSSRNLPTNYRDTEESHSEGVVEKRLKMPESIGDHIDITENLPESEVVEAWVIFDEVYPRKVGTITDVSFFDKEISDEDGGKKKIRIFRFRDSSLSFKSSYILPGETLKVYFNSGLLNGREYEVEFNPLRKGEDDPDFNLFEIVLNEDYGVLTPNEILKPEVGNTYILHGYNALEFVSEQLIPAAEQELYEKAKEYLDKAALEKAVFSCKTKKVRCSGWVNNVYYPSKIIDLDVGQKVTLSTVPYLVDGFETRVRGFEKTLSNIFDCTYKLGDASKYSRLDSIEAEAKDANNKITHSSDSTGSSIHVITRYDASAPSDHNVFSAARTEDDFLSKKKPGVVEETVIFNKQPQLKSGFTSDSFQQGSSGAAVIKTENGWLAEVDLLNVRKKFTSKEVEINKTTHIGGSQLLTAACCKAVRVENEGTFFRVFFQRRDGEGSTITNDWEVGDQAYSRTFNLEESADGTLGNRYYWRVVVGVGKDSDLNWIDLSNEVVIQDSVFSDIDYKKGFDDGSSEPMAGDVIVQLGNRLGTVNRTSVIEMSATSLHGPFIKQYTHVTRFELGEAEVQISPNNNIFKGLVSIQEGSSGLKHFDDLSEAVKIGGANLLRNTGFDGEFESIIPSEVSLNNIKEVYNDELEFWSYSEGAEAVEYEKSTSHKACLLKKQNDFISQDVTLKKDVSYILSAKSSSPFTVTYAGNSFILGEEDKSWIQIFGTGLLSNISFKALSSDTILWNIKLEEGTLPTEWTPSSQDTDPIASNFKADRYIVDILREGQTDVLGGLILTNMILCGMFRDGVLQKVTAGISGIMNDGEDIAMWAGGDFNLAVTSMAKIRSGESLSDTEWNSLIGFAATHGGDLFLKGYIYALGGIFRGKVYANDGEFKGKVYANDGEFRGKVYAKEGEFKGAVNARLFYSSVKMNTASEHKINPAEDGCNSYIWEYDSVGTWNPTSGTWSSHWIYLPDATHYEGLELSFYFLRENLNAISKYLYISAAEFEQEIVVIESTFVTTTISGQVIVTDQRNMRRDSRFRCLSNVFTKIKAVNGSWLMIEGYSSEE